MILNLKGLDKRKEMVLQRHFELVFNQPVTREIVCMSMDSIICQSIQIILVLNNQINLSNCLFLKVCCITYATKISIRI